MEKQLSFFYTLSLQEITLRRIAVDFWSKPDILAMIESFYSIRGSSVYNKEWTQIVENRIIDKISTLKLPESLKTQLLPIVTVVGLHIQRWKWFHEHFLFFSLTFSCSILAKLCWTTAGAIDFERTAVELIQLKKINILKRYRVACYFCLEEFIPVLWDELPEESKKVFYNEKDTSFFRDIKFRSLEYFWPYIIKGKQSILTHRLRSNIFGITFNQFALEDAAEKGNKAAVKYFFKKLTQEEKDSCFVSTTEQLLSLDSSLSEREFFNTTVDVLYYLWSQMNHEQLIEVFRKYAYSILILLLDWPFENIFLKNPDFIWNFISADQYIFINMALSGYIMLPKCFYSKVYQELFTHSPDCFKKQLAFVL